MKSNAQGAIEYLLLLAAAVVVVAIVIGFLSGLLDFTIDEGTVQKYSSICDAPINSQTENCQCYRGEIEKEVCCLSENVNEDLKSKILNCS